MAKNHKWYVAGTAIAGIAVGIVFCGVFSNAMHWAGSTQFCGEFCHSMDVTYAAYKKGLHFNTRTGMHAGCSDCHLLNEANEHNSPLQYGALLVDKVVSASHSGFGELRGSLNTPQKQVEERDRMAKDVHNLMLEREFSNCRACHDVTAMNNPKKPILSKFHRRMSVGQDPKIDCLACHPTAGHDYKAAKEDIDKLLSAAK